VRNLFFILIFFAGLLLAGADLTILAVSDTHAGCWRWRSMADAILEHRRMAGAENVLLLDAGDSLQGSWEGTFRNGALPLAIMNELQVDAWVPGNHDFEESPERFLQFRGVLLGGDWQTARVKPRAWMMFERAGRKIAVIGLGEWGMRSRVLPHSGMIFSDPEVVLAKAVREAQAAGADLQILVQHDGEFGSYGTLHRRLKKFPEIQLVIGAHTHQEVPGKKIGSAWYVQPGSHGSSLGVIRVQFREKGEVPVLTSSLEKLPAHGEYRFPQKIYTDLAAVARSGNTVLGYVPGGLAQPADRDMKGMFGDLAEKALREETGAVAVLFCMYQGRARSPEKVTAASLYQVYPYESRIYSVALTPQELQTVIQELAAFQRKKKGLAIRFGGVKIYRDKRGGLQRAVLPSPGPDGRILTAMTDYELTGCAGRIPFLPGLLRNCLEYRNTNILLRDAVSCRLVP
jgi:2',3'-cyclic-nucleotide 2'-phosphodiesterase (5'-nucleotidase family)